MGGFRTDDAGKTWRIANHGTRANFLPQNKGLPQQNAFAGIYRKGMATDARNPAGIYFGTNTGKLFGSADEGDS